MVEQLDNLYLKLKYTAFDLQNLQEVVPGLDSVGIDLLSVSFQSSHLNFVHK